MAVEIKLPTLEEYLAYGDQPIEVVDGEIIEMSPNTKRQPRIMLRLLLRLATYVDERKLGEVLPEASYVLDGEPRRKWVKNARTPDISFISQARLDAHEEQHPTQEEPWWLAPDIAVEVVSPTDQYTKVNRKISDYLHYGVKLIWVIDPADQTMRVYTADTPNGVILNADDTLTAEPVIEGWSMPVAELFAE